MELWKDGTKWAREERLVEVWPSVEPAPRPRRRQPVRAFDPTEESRLPCLEKLGCPVKPIASLDGRAGRRKYLVIGPNCATSDGGKARPGRDFVRDGGRVLMLAPGGSCRCCRRT